MPKQTKPHGIIPSLLSANPLRLADDINQLTAAGITMVHLDIMDNHYVPNLTFGPSIAEALHRQFPTLLVDVHLMINPVDAMIDEFAKRSVRRISIHPEATPDLLQSLLNIKAHGIEVGLALNPMVAFEPYINIIPMLDFMLIMTVNPGFAGQAFMPEVLHKITAIHQAFPQLTLCVDGGINAQTLTHLAKTGATQFVVGTGLFEHGDLIHTLNGLTGELIA